MELDHRSLFILLCVDIFLYVNAQVTFDPDEEGDKQLEVGILETFVNVTTVQCYAYPTSSEDTPDIKVQYVGANDNEVVYDVIQFNQSFSVPGSTCGQDQRQYGILINNLQFIADPVLVGGTFRLKATVNNNESLVAYSRRTYSFPAPFNLTGSSESAVLNSEFTWTCHVTSTYPVIEWYQGIIKLTQLGILPNGSCETFEKNSSYTYNYDCQRSALTYTLTIPGQSLTEKLQDTQWRCKDVTSELRGSKFLTLDIVVPVTSVTISPGGGGSTFDADENEMVNFTCTTNDANPSPTILWYIGSSDVTSQATGSSKSTLTLNVSREYHQVSVRCSAGNSGNTGNLENSTRLSVRYPPGNNEKLQIMGYTSGQVLYENNSAMINISCTQPGGNPVVNMTLTCGSQTGINGNTAMEAIRKLNLTNDRNLNGQQCVCESTHINGYMRKINVNFTVYYPPSVPSISTSSPFPWKSEGTYRLTCNTTPGIPVEITYIWKEGVSVLPITSQKYEFKPLNSTDNGRQLSCQVNNNFTLHEKVNLTSDNTTLQVEFQPATNETLEIVGYNSGQVLYENNSAIINITCIQPGGNPVANMTFTCGSGTGPGTNENTDTEAIRRLSLTKNRILNGLKCECVSTHINGYTRNKSVTFIVYYPPSVPTISLSSGFPWKATNTYNFTCNTTPGYPAGTRYIWKEGVFVLPIPSQTYEFKPLNSTDNGRELHCQVDNDFTLHKNVTLTSIITTLKVEYGPDVTLDQSSVEVIEGHTAVLRCSATGNPLPTVTWYRDSTPVTGSTISSSTYNITNASRTLTGNYTCKANSSSTGGNILQPDEMNAHLRVFYPPRVQIHLQNTTENTRNHTLRCSATGDPNNATIVALQQRIGSTFIRNITSFTESSPGNMTLNIDSVSYQDMGIYTCLASNGIPDRSNQKIESDVGYLNVNTSAKFETIEYTVRSDIGTHAAISILFYINPLATESDVMWINNTGTSNDTLVSSTNVTLSLSDADVNRTLHGVDVILHGQSANMEIPTFQDYYEGNYTLKVRSHTDSSEVRIVLVRSGPPDTPSDFQLLTRKVTSVDLTWNKGSDGGHPQTFVILYKEKTAEVYKREELNDTSTNRNITHEIKSLQSNTNYYFLLYSFNKKGNSTGYKTLEEMTLKAPEEAPQSSLNSGLVGGAAGGGAAVLVVVIVIIVVMRRRQHHGKGNNSKGILNSKEMSAGSSRQNDYDDGEVGLKDNPLYVSSTSEMNVTQGASAEPENPSLYAEVVKLKKKSPAKETMDPPPIYAQVNKSKEKNGKGPLKPQKKSPAKGGEDLPPIYAEVDKSDKKKDKGKHKKQKAKGKMEGDVYENVDGFKEKETQFNDPTEKQDTKKPRGYRNQDGLLYIDVKFDQPPQKGKPIIHGEERTGYAMIEFEEPPTYSTADEVKGAEGGK